MNDISVEQQSKPSSKQKNQFYFFRLIVQLIMTDFRILDFKVAQLVKSLFFG